jgi:hypothetical protein
MNPKDTKLSLSEEDIALIGDTSFFEKKRKIFLKISHFFGQLEDTYSHVLNQASGTLPDVVFSKRGKISKGENYKGLPYMILDYPGVFSKEGVFAYRTLFWWGNPFSFTFHVSGIYLPLVMHEMMQVNLQKLSNSMICVNSSQWEHHFEKENYLPLQDVINTFPDFITMVRERGFLKITRLAPLDHPQIIEDIAVEQLKEMITLTR